jgi:hypothetical protein
MTDTNQRTEHLVQKLRRALPLAAYGRPVLTSALRRSLACPDVAARVMVTDIFYAGEENGLMCRINVQGKTGQQVLVVAPIAQLAFNRRQPAAREIAAYCKRRAGSGSATTPKHLKSKHQ